jgi:hypothetical protein
LKTRNAGKIQSKLVTLIYGDTFSGKTTLGLQLAEFHNEDGSPFRLAVVDCEGGGVDDALAAMEDSGEVNMDNIKVFYTQSLQEISELLNKIKNHEKFYMYDDEGEETDEVMKDADGKDFFPDAILIDGTSVLKMTSEQGLLELSKKRNMVKANKQELTGAEKFVKVQGASLEFKDYQTLNYSGQQLVLDLMALGINVVITSREKDEKKNINSNGKIESVSTGRKIPDSYKGIDYNAKTILHTFIDPQTHGVCLQVVKDRTGVFKAGEIIEDPTLTVWQSVINRNKGKKSFVLENGLDKAIETEQKMYEKKSMHLLDEDEKTEEKKEAASKKPVNEVHDLQKNIMDTIKALPKGEKGKRQLALKNAGLPTNFSTVTDVEVLKKIYEVVSK